LLPEDYLRFETCWGDFKCFNVKFYVSASVGVLMKVNITFHISTLNWVEIYETFMKRKIKEKTLKDTQSKLQFDDFSLFTQF